MDILTHINQKLTFFDGGTGTLLQEAGLVPGTLPETWNLSHPRAIIDIHRDYYNSGANVVSTNTFGANILKFNEDELIHIISAAVKNAKCAREQSCGEQEKYIALDIGPTGKLLKPYGDLDFEEAVSVFAQTVRIGVQCGVDMILIETMSDSYETKAALLAAKENSHLPVIVSNAYDESGTLMTGATPEVMIAMLEGMGADVIGVNCSFGPKTITPVVEKYLKHASVPVLVMPNAGLPKFRNGKTIYDVGAKEFAADVTGFLRAGVRVAGGCCGTTPEHIAALVRSAQNTDPVPIVPKNETTATSSTRVVCFSDAPVLIGERINPTGKKRFQQALKEHDIDYLLNEGIRQQEKGVHVLDVNVGLPGIDEAKTLTEAVCELQTVTDLPLQIDTSNPTAMERALRRYNGKAIINSVNGKAESMAAVFPLAKKYGGLVVALTLDESGIPDTAEGRVAVARKILAVAQTYGIRADQIVFDPLAMTISAMPDAACVAVEALCRIRDELGCHTSLGVSNISFGLPHRDAINSAFFLLALEHGLSAAIMNPDSAEMMKAYYAFRALRSMDPNCSDYVSFASAVAVVPAATVSASAPGSAESAEYASPLQRAIVKGLKEQSARLTEEMISRVEPLSIINDEILPALNITGKGFEEKTVFLPQLLMSAEAANVSFEVIKSAVAGSGDPSVKRCKFVLATVRGDIHDIGKNIVKLLLENYGFDVIDLGKDVPVEAVADAVVREHAPLAGLSALMTTTVPCMEATIRELRRRAPWCKVVVGGAVLTKEYAETIGADHYAKDAMEAVRYAESIDKIQKKKGET